MRFTFIGCSFTVGVGLDHEKNDVNNYTNIVANHCSADVKNSAVGGNSNYNIFMTAVNEILFNTPDKIFVQWSNLNRLWLYPGPNTKLVLSHTIKTDYEYRDIFYSKKELQKFTDTYHILNHDYNNEFIIEFDTIWIWVGFTRKDHAKRLLEKYFVLDLDYKVLLLPKEEQNTKEVLLHSSVEQNLKQDKRGGNNKETILLTINTFKKFCKSCLLLLFIKHILFFTIYYFNFTNRFR